MYLEVGMVQEEHIILKYLKFSIDYTNISILKIAVVRLVNLDQQIIIIQKSPLDLGLANTLNLQEVLMLYQKEKIAVAMEVPERVLNYDITLYFPKINKV